MLEEVRRAAVAGSFYPADPRELGAMLVQMLNKIRPAAPAKAIIAPHAGYVYSGPIAATAYATLRSVRKKVKRVVLLGPSHRIAFRGLALSGAAAYETPLGRVPLDHTTGASLANIKCARVIDAAHEKEHSLEVQVPFLQLLLAEFCLVPIVVGDAMTEEVAAVLDQLWGGEETLVVVSSDLSHYLPYEDACEVDANTASAIEARHEDLTPEQACGCRCINGLLHALSKRRMPIKTLDLRNSGDTAGSRDRVVGYGAFAAA